MLNTRGLAALTRMRKRVRDAANRVLAATVAVLPDRSRLALRAPTTVVRRIDYPRHEIWLSVDSELEYAFRLRACAREPETVAWIEHVMAAGDVFYDVGANDGVYSLVAAKFFDGNVTVYAFEPAFMNFAQLCRNLILNRCGSNIVPLPIALSDTTALAPFRYNNLIEGGSLHALGTTPDAGPQSFTPVWSQQMLSYRLDDLVEEFGLYPPNHIKLDVDGNELAVLEGAEATLQSGAVRSVIVEDVFLEHRGDRIAAVLSAKGFSPYQVSSSPASRGRPRNRIFVRTGDGGR